MKIIHQITLYFLAFIILTAICMGVLLNRVHALNVAHQRLAQEWKEMRLIGRFLEDVEELITTISTDEQTSHINAITVNGLKDLVPVLEDIRNESLRKESFEENAHMLSERDNFISIRQQFMAFVNEAELLQMKPGMISADVRRQIVEQLELLKRSADRLKDFYEDEMEEASAFAQRARKQILYQIIVLCAVFLFLLAFVTRWFIVLLKRNTEAMIKHEQGTTIGLLAQSLAHEIRNPLGVISVSASVICGKLPSASEERELAEGMVVEAKRIGALLEQLLVLNKSKVELASCDPSKIIADVVMLLAPMSEKKNVTIRLDDRAGIREAFWDRDQIKQMLINLLFNSIDAAPGGTVEISTSLRPGFYEIMITDNGPGFTPHARTRAFEPFFSTKESGTGLGLFVARSIVDAHKGRIGIASRVESGARLEVSLPLMELK